MHDSSGVFTSLLVLAIIVAVVTVFIRISLRVRKGGGSLTTLSMGATDEFLSKEQSQAVEVIVEENAGKPLEAQSSSDPDLRVVNSDK